LTGTAGRGRQLAAYRLLLLLLLLFAACCCLLLAAGTDPAV
jgi:hypothetical protein